MANNKLVVTTDVEKTLHSLHKILNDVVDLERKAFRNPKPQRLSEGNCDGLSLVAESSIRRNLSRQEVIDIGQRIIAKPLDAEVAAESTKKWCTKIAAHFRRILDLLVLVSEAFDTEMNGKRSMAGIVFQNMYFHPGAILEVHFCAVPQSSSGAEISSAAAMQQVYPHAQTFDRNAIVDFSNLMGLHTLVEKFMNEKAQPLHASRRFLKQLQYALFQTHNVEFLRLICNDPLVDKRKVFPFVSCHKGITMLPPRFEAPDTATEASSAKFMLSVPSRNPVFQSRYCGKQEKYVVPFKYVSRQYRDMRLHYTESVQNICKLVTSALVTRARPELAPIMYELRSDITQQKLDDIETKAKRIIVSFMLQSLIDFHHLMNECSHVPHVPAKS